MLRRLLKSRSGVAATEFALAAPFLLGFGLWGIETANLALTHMKVSQLAMHIADNASRIGDTSTLEDRKIFEEDVQDLLLGANLQGGGSLDFFTHGRAMISSLEVWDQSILSGTARSDGPQFIHWQRCKGVLPVDSSYGVENSAQPNGMGPTGHEVIASEDSPVIFVELVYEYQPLVSTAFVPGTRITATSAFMVRDSRDQSQLYQRNAGAQIADCSIHDAFPPA